MPTPTETPAPSTNGELIDRVQQLRLSNQLAAGGSGSGRGSWLPWVLCGLMAVAWAGVGVRWYRASESPGEGGPGAAKGPGGGSGGTPAGPGASGPAIPQGGLVLQVKGVLAPYMQITLSPIDVAGEVTEINFKEGDRVFANKTVLAKIRSTRYQNDATNAAAGLLSARAQVARAEATLAATRSREAKSVSAAEAATARIAKARASVVQATLDLERAQTPVTAVATRDEAVARKAIAEAEERAARADLTAAEKEIEAAKADAKAAEAGVDAARSEVNGAQARKDEADRVLANCEIKAPIDGTILTKSVEKGSLVSPMSFNVASGICTMADLSDLEAEIAVREEQVGDVRPGQECQVVSAAAPGRTYKGRVDRIMPIADDTNSTIKVRVKVQLPAIGQANEEPGQFLKPKMSTVVRIYNTQIPEFGAKK